MKKEITAAMANQSTKVKVSSYSFIRNLKMNKMAWLLLLAIALLIGGLISVRLGQDANWDLLNYHLYVAWAYLHGRFGIDLFPAGIQSYFAPFIDIPYYLIATQWLPNSPRLVAFVMGLPYGVLIFIVFLIAWLVTGEIDKVHSHKAVLAILTVLFGVTGVATFPQIGTTFGDIPIAAITLLGLVLILYQQSLAAQQWSKVRQSLLIIFAGLVFGIAAGLKLTACIYASGAALIIILGTGAGRTRLIHAMLFCISWLASFLSIWGPWGLALFKYTGNPFFPLFNSVFRSSWIAPVIGMDARHFPKSLMQAIFFPFYWANNHNNVMDPHFLDPRFAVIYTLALVTLGIWTIRRFVKVPHLRKMPVTKSLLIFFIISYIIWESLFSALRYAVTLEVLLGIVLLIFLAYLLNYSIHQRILSLIFFLTIAVTGVLIFTQYPVWGRVGYANKVFEIHTKRVPGNSLVLFVGKPLAYLAPFVAPLHGRFKFIGITDTPMASKHYKLYSMLESDIENWQGPIYYIANKDTLTSVPRLSLFGLYPLGPCSRITSNIDIPSILCPVTHVPNALAWPRSRDNHSYVLDKIISFSRSGRGSQFTGKGWSTPEHWGTWTDSGQAGLLVKLPKGISTPLELTFLSHAFLVPQHPQLKVTVKLNGITLTHFTYRYPRDRYDLLRKVSIPARLMSKKNGVLKFNFLMTTPASPQSLGISSDARHLGLGLVWFNIKPSE